MREILITATVLILCILLIRRIFRGKISSRLLYALWLLVAIRLVGTGVAQVDLGPLSDFRLMDLVEKDESGIAERLNKTIRLEEPIQMTVDSRSILFRLFTTDAVRESVKEATGGIPGDGPTAVFVAGKLGFSRLDVLWFIWGIGAFTVGMWIIVTNIVFSRRLRKSRQVFTLPEDVKTAVFGNKEAASGENAATVDLQTEEGPQGGKSRRIFSRKRRLPAFYLAEGISSPCLYGFPGREAVYLTKEVAADTDRLRHVIVHELVHKKHGDSFWAILRSALAAVYWFHPLVWVAAVCSKRDCELACDEGALKLLGEEERISYGETLLSIITRKGHASDLVCTATTMTGSGKSVKERIRFIAERPKTLVIAVAGVLILTAAVCLFVFTKDAGFQGTIVDSQKGLTVTGADMQITLPASIGDISGCVVDEKSDNVVIYHIAAQEEVGRFARMPLKDALQLVDEGRQVLPIGDYGYNYLLRAYLGEPLSRTEHIYTPATQGVLEHEDRYFPAEPDDGTAYPKKDENPMRSKDWKVVPLEEEDASEGKEKQSGGALGHEDVYTPVEEEARDYLPNETITAQSADSSNKRTEHTYTPNPSETGEAGIDSNAAAGVPGTDSNAAAGVPGTDSNDDDTTYMLDDSIEYEDSVEYLPNEEITVTYQPHEVNVDEIKSGCYVYVSADYQGKVKDKYREAMDYIDSQLRAAADQVVILSLNRERREALFDALTANRTPYVGDNAKVGALIDALPLPPTLNRAGGFSMQTLEAPYSLRFDYEMSTDLFTKEDQDMLYFNAAMLFYAIGNVEEISMEVRGPSGIGTTMNIYHREELEKDLSLLQNADYEDDQVFREGLPELLIAVETQLTAD